MRAYVEMFLTPWVRFVLAVFFALALCSAVSSAFAQALPQPVFNGAANDNFYRVIEKKALERGFPANDNRVLKTATAIGRRAAVTANATSSTAGTVARALLWLPTAARRAAIVGGAIAISAGITWLLKSDGKVEVQAGQQSGGSYGGVTSGGAWWQSESTIYGSCGGTNQAAAAEACIPLALAKWLAGNNPTGGVQSVTPKATQSLSNRIDYTITYTHNGVSGQTTNGYVYGNQKATGAPVTCQTGMIYNGACSSGQAAPTVADNEWKGVDMIPPERFNEEVKPGAVADVVNDLWKDAASQPGYDGLPYDIYNPVTAPTADAVRQADPSKWPKVSDWLRPVSPEATTGTPVQTVPIPYNPPSTGGPVTSPGSSTGTGDPINLGTDPGIPAPSLEQTPTAKMIMDPLLNVMPGLRSFVVPSHSASCPTWTFSIDLWSWHQQVSMAQHCTLFENNRAAIAAIMVVVWTLVALFVILTA